MRNILYILAFSIVLSSCTEEHLSTEHTKIVEIDVNERKDYNFSSFFDTCYIVPLETTQSSLIGGITNVVLNGENIFILDSDKSKSIFVYGWKGELKSVINNLGEGPGQYLYPLSISVSEPDSILLLTDSRRQQNLSYTFNGDFINSRKLDPSSMYMDLIQSNGYFYTTGGDNISKVKFVNKLDSDFNILKKINMSLKNDVWIQNGIKTNYFYEKSNGSGFLYKGHLTNSVFDIENDSITHITQFKFSSNSFDFDPDRPTQAVELAERIRKSENYVVGDQILDSYKYLFIDIIKGGYISMAIYNKDTEEAHLVGELINDMDGTFISIPGMTSSANTANYFVVSLFPIEFKELMSIKKVNGPYDQVLKSIELNGADNPILFIYRFKK